MTKFFLLTYNFFDKKDHYEIHLFAVSKDGTPAKIIIDSFRPLFFIPRSTPKLVTTLATERKSLSLKFMDNTSIDCLYFKNYSDYQECLHVLKQKGIKTYESDVNPCERYLMERMVAGGFSVSGPAYQKYNLTIFKNPRIRGTDIDISLSVLSIDIEINTGTGEIYSIACYGKTETVFIIGNITDNVSTAPCKNEPALLNSFLKHVKNEDPDIIIGWNVINFDLVIIKKRCEEFSIPFEIGRDYGTSIKPKKEGPNQFFARVPGRIILDVPVMLRANHYSFDKYSLNHVASKMLGKRKTIELTGRSKIKEINRLFREDKASLAVYNLQDAKLAKEIFDKSNMLSNTIERSKLSGHLLDHYGGSITAFDYVYLPRLHREGYVAGNVEDITVPDVPLPGGYVIEPKPGIYENVLMFDFKSLYPTIIMTFHIDPLGAIINADNSVKGPVKIPFSLEKSILPGIISELMAARKKAKQENNQPLSYAIKILMNSFYGVLGSTGCRFFSPDIAHAITGTGQYILKTTRKYIEESTPYSVIYGDTDSLFVLLGEHMETQAKGIERSIISDVNTWLKKHLKEQFNVESKLELEFETLFRHFFMPAIRGSTQGSKKRYCGTIEKDGELILEFKGLESARSDWTALAKEFQHTLYRKVFLKEPVKEFILSTVRNVKMGEVDDKLIYRKHLRKPVDEYTVNIPPHVQAAKLLKEPGRIIHYCITTQGPKPVENISSSLDYNHYIDCQLKPIADSILEWIGLDFDSIISGQQNLFDSPTS
jgi:DNA polymerase-2